MNFFITLISAGLVLGTSNFWISQHNNTHYVFNSIFLEGSWFNNCVKCFVMSYVCWDFVVFYRFLMFSDGKRDMWWWKGDIKKKLKKNCRLLLKNKSEFILLMRKCHFIALWKQEEKKSIWAFKYRFHLNDHMRKTHLMVLPKVKSGPKIANIIKMI